MINSNTGDSISDSFLIEMLGLIAGACTSFGLVPQVIKGIKTKSAGDLAWGWLLLTILGLVLWLIYGLLIESLALIVANSFSFFCVLIIIYIKWHY